MSKVNLVIGKDAHCSEGEPSVFCLAVLFHMQFSITASR